ncbi:MAG TPA: phosphoglycerate kinase [archaeon]|nr:phosphoglycerate kinase [archaeon]
MYELNGFKFLSEVNIENKTVLFRCDLNSNIVNHDLEIKDRIIEHSKAIKELSDKKAKLVVMTHQGRHGQEDYISLKQHSKALEKVIGKLVKFHAIDENVDKEIKSLNAGEILLLENTRFMFEEKINRTAEMHSRTEWIQLISGACDLFVQDALSVCHRPHASVIGFCPLLPRFVGPTLERELKAINKVFNETKKPRLLVLGGVKLNEPIDIMKIFLQEEKADFVLAGGMLGICFLKAKGISLGKEEEFIKENGFEKYIADLKFLLEKFKEKIILPTDLALDENGFRNEAKIEDFPKNYLTKDIGHKSIKLFNKYINEASTVIANGPQGVFEDKVFMDGTKKVFETIADSKAFTLIGGGQTTDAINALKISKEKFDLVSLSGGALLDYLAGKKLPGLECFRY